MKKIENYNDLVFFIDTVRNTLPEIPEELIFTFKVSQEVYNTIDKKLYDDRQLYASMSSHISTNQFFHSLSINIMGIKIIVTTDLSDCIDGLIKGSTSKDSWFDNMDRMMKIGRSFSDNGYSTGEFDDRMFKSIIQHDRSMKNFLKKKYPFAYIDEIKVPKRIVTKDKDVIMSINDAVNYMKNNPGLIEQIRSVEDNYISISGDPTYKDIEYLVEKLKPKEPIDLSKHMVKLFPFKNKLSPVEEKLIKIQATNLVKKFSEEDKLERLSETERTGNHDGLKLHKQYPLTEKECFIPKDLQYSEDGISWTPILFDDAQFLKYMKDGKWRAATTGGVHCPIISEYLNKKGDKNEKQ